VKVSYLGNVYQSYCEPVIYVSHAGRDGGSRFPRGGSEVSFSSPALDSRQGVSIKHVRIKQECCVKKVITVGVQ